MELHVGVFEFTARQGGRHLQELKPEQRADIIIHLAEALLNHQEEILKANQLDVSAAIEQG
jgi:gamma-glutamyl phosphate reductase